MMIGNWVDVLIGKENLADLARFLSEEDPHRKMRKQKKIRSDPR